MNSSDLSMTSWLIPMCPIVGYRWKTYRAPDCCRASTMASALAMGTERSLSECRISNGFIAFATCFVGEACTRRLGISVRRSP